MKPCHFIIACVVLALVAAVTPALATHIVGGEMTYVCLGPDGPNRTRYRIQLDLYQDCLEGVQDVIEQDNPAFFSIFDGNNMRVLIDTAVYSRGKVSVPPNFSNQCVNNPPATCLDKTTFIREYSLPNNETGYRVVYQRCCRNASIINVVNPAASGATYSCTIPPVGVSCNNSAVFKNYPPQIICINNPLIYDHSATDADGDSLSYEFCQGYMGGSLDVPKPVPGPPPYPPLRYIGGFTMERPMAGSPLIQIDPTTGIISGTPNLEGRFVVTVCCHEWRNGTLINTVTREFQFVVTNCSKAVVADIPQYSNDFNTYVVSCDGYTVKFKNNSIGGFEYHWDFGLSEVPSATSSAFEPEFTYPDTGTYTVKLVVNRGSTCPDSISRFVKIYPYFNADFDFTGKRCPGEPITFSDKSQGSFMPVRDWRWKFGDGNVSSQQNPTHAYNLGGAYNVTLISENVKGCVDSVTKVVTVDQFVPFAGNDTIIVRGESIQFNATGGDHYIWTPSAFLNDTTIRNPIGYYPDTATITYYVYVSSNNGCQGEDSVRVQVVRQASIFVPNAFTPNGDGRNDILRVIGIGYRRIEFFRIYNRYGQEVYFSSDLRTGWDGTLNGGPAPSGVYYWVAKVIDRFGREEMLKGDVTLLR
jgi:gliding motility-associated-like protein